MSMPFYFLRARCPGLVLLGWIGMALAMGTPLHVSAAHASATHAKATEPANGSAQTPLRFVTRAGDATALSLPALRKACPAERLTVDDPYHARPMHYFALPLICVLDLGFKDIGGSQAMRGQGLLLRALDGYTRPAAGSDLVSPDAYIAYGEVESMQRPDAAPRFSPIDRRKVDPAPYYLIWSGRDQNDPHVFPWPYQLATIEMASFREAFPRTLPAGLDDADAGWAGYAIFERSCSACHSVNGEGGKIGPDLNIPKSIVEYRPVEQIKSYIRDPEATRYTNMPAHPLLSDADLDALVAYFKAMSARKHDPRIPPGAAAP